MNNTSESNNKKRVLLTAIGSRGDVQPLLAVALALKSKGCEPVIAVGPNW